MRVPPASLLKIAAKWSAIYGLVSLVTLIVMLWTDPAMAQALTLDLGDGGGSTTGRIIQTLAVMTVISLAPSILMMVTSFTRIVIVLSLLRNALGVPQSPPNSVMVALAVFLTGFIMQPTLEQAYNQGLRPLIAEEITETQALDRTIEPLHGFMIRHVREKDLRLFFDLARVEPPAAAAQTPLRVLIPAFMISELRRAFEIGFLLFIPFLVIDMVVASILMAMGMMMLPPVIISLPFKLIFFVLVDGWYLVAGSLVRSFNE
ncbi:flagellar biosynthetic protein FliP [Elstera cyanobacteriorum]|uniref:Flagellar biosynthetic protein FliP n=1 Tax=Elstera cyanobacteriorum TaxID=2022747 RepID=A0A255XP29_9PROT|nr:flagellar type III secretion system pore protein FliP [Elstera cyanobacteriorum]OYQ18737.1 flagellar biosynthetic protein FliP [Elstera cyanobacteriorum]GFZ78047.1 flagellar biosynthetic protein FliP [Elstera cyanobacteriorum]